VEASHEADEDLMNLKTALDDDDDAGGTRRSLRTHATVHGRSSVKAATHLELNNIRTINNS